MGNKIIRLGDYCDIIKGSTGIKKAIPGEFPLVVTAEERQSHNEYQFDTTAVIIPLVSSTGHGHASIKRLHYQEGKFALGTILCALIIKDTTIINPRFLYIYLSYFKDHLLVPLMKGAANVTLSIKKIKDVEIILPSLERQLEILDLESNSDLIDELSFEIQTQKQLISQLKQAILQEAIQGKLTQEWREQNPNTEPASELLERIKAEKEQLIKDKKIKKEKPLPPIEEDEIPFEIPESWVWCRIGEVYQSTSGGTPTRGNHEYWNGNIKWYKSGELNDGLLSIDSKEHITNKGLKESSATLFPKGTLLIAMYGATAGKLAIINSEATTNQAVCGFFENNMLSTSYLFNFFRANRDKMIKESWGMSQPNISQTYLKNFVFALPPFEEQKAIIEKVETLMQKCNALEQEITQSEQHANMLMQAVLKEAFESKVIDN
ncbi:restriction endonuclease subunit S [Mesoflavibacter zeaxanthinifaciens]|uniref:restriction endonuclease subunit S n=1 Tax=Mesoflavibacter zeaxanthinifaciens TaxID=393060 RepID=UPI0026F31B79|nr:restriction endonuclease subunit S [Mesoflavibacter zeaxanthinifaciens]